MPKRMPNFVTANGEATHGKMHKQHSYIIANGNLNMSKNHAFYQMFLSPLVRATVATFAWAQKACFKSQLC